MEDLHLRADLFLKADHYWREDLMEDLHLRVDLDLMEDLHLRVGLD